jgi:hypothetical protein
MFAGWRWAHSAICPSRQQDVHTRRCLSKNAPQATQRHNMVTVLYPCIVDCTNYINPARLQLSFQQGQCHCGKLNITMRLGQFGLYLCARATIPVRRHTPGPSNISMIRDRWTQTRRTAPSEGVASIVSGPDRMTRSGRRSETRMGLAKRPCIHLPALRLSRSDSPTGGARDGLRRGGAAPADGAPTRTSGALLVSRRYCR